MVNFNMHTDELPRVLLGEGSIYTSTQCAVGSLGNFPSLPLVVGKGLPALGDASLCSKVTLAVPPPPAQPSQGRLQDSAGTCVVARQQGGGDAVTVK